MKLWETLGLGERSVRIADVGAAVLGRATPYRRLLESGVGRLFAFEPDENRHDELRSHLDGDAVLLPYALADGSRQTLYVAPGGMTSILEPDPESFAFLTPFGMPPFLPFEDSVRPVAVPTRRLDDVSEIPSIDFLKIDIQGGELVVLNNGWEKLRECAVIQIEVSFLSLYKGQPSFADVDSELRRHGFMVHGLAEMSRMPIAPFRPHDLWRGLNQLVEVDMIYVRDVKDCSSLSTDQLRKTAVIADDCYGSFDLAVRCIAELEARGACEPETAARYLASVPGRSRRIVQHDLPAWD
jgi:FkbM family methyltransferase